MGGKILIVEAIKYPSSKFKIEVTGQLGDVMKVFQGWLQFLSDRTSNYIEQR